MHFLLIGEERILIDRGEVPERQRDKNSLYPILCIFFLCSYDQNCLVDSPERGLPHSIQSLTLFALQTHLEILLLPGNILCQMIVLEREREEAAVKASSSSNYQCRIFESHRLSLLASSSFRTFLLPLSLSLSADSAGARDQLDNLRVRASLDSLAGCQELTSSSSLILSPRAGVQSD